MKRLVPTLIGALAAAATLAPAAQASISIGSLAPPDIVCLSLDGQPFTQLQLGLAGGVPFSAPSNGVITSFQVHSGDSRMTELVFKAARPAMPAGHYTIIGQQAAGPQTADAITTTLTRIPVQTGDVIGMSVLGGSCVSSGGMGDSLGTADMEGDIQPGQTNNYADDQQTLLPIAATIEPDADGDGFGDETQDRCPGVAGPENGCPPAPGPTPDTTKPTLGAVSAKSLKLSKGGAISFFMTASETATGSATGTVNVPNGSKVIRFKSARVKLTPGVVSKLTLKLSKKNSKKVRAAIRRHKKLRAKITVTVTDAAGNKSIKQLSPRLN